MHFVELKTVVPKHSSLPYEAHINNILLSHNLNRKLYLISMFDMEGIKIEFENNSNYDFFVGRNVSTENLICRSMKRRFISSKNLLLEYLCKMLSLGRYCYLAIDSFEIEQYMNYKEKHIVHSPLVAGIDFDNHLIKLCDFFNYSEYSVSWVNLDNFVNGYFNIQEIIETDVFSYDEKWLLDIETIEIFKNEFDWNSKSLLEGCFKKYLRGEQKYIYKENAFLKINSILNGEKICSLKEVEKVQGLKVYTFLKIYFNNLIKKNDFDIENKSLSLLKQHFVLLEKLLIEIDDLNIKRLCKECLNSSERILVIGLKIKISQNTKMLGKICELIEEVEKKEEKILRLFLESTKE